MLALLPLALPEQAPSASAKDRLMGSLADRFDSGESMKITPAAAGESHPWKLQGLLAIAASMIIFFVSLALLFHVRQQGRQQDELAKTWESALAETRAELASQTV